VKIRYYAKVLNIASKWDYLLCSRLKSISSVTFMMQAAAICVIIPGHVVMSSFVCPAVSSLRMTLPSLYAVRKSQRPYRYGMILLCVGALINWLGLAENYVEPVRYIGVACIIAGAMLICAAMCCWLQRPAFDHPDDISQVNHNLSLRKIDRWKTIIHCSTGIILISRENAYWYNAKHVLIFWF
jgi:hypothetical protein